MIEFLKIQSRMFIRRITADEAWRCGIDRTGGGDLRSSAFGSSRPAPVGIRTKTSA